MTSNPPLWLKLTLLSDTTFGRGDGVAGLVDAEVQHDSFGLPYLGGKTLKGLLGATCAEILFALEKAQIKDLAAWHAAGRYLFGEPGSLQDEMARLRVGDARLPADFRMAVEQEYAPLLEMSSQTREREWGRKRRTYLENFTALRRQTAMDAQTGAPLRNTLRTRRIIVRQTIFVAELDFREAPQNLKKQDMEKWLLATCVKGFRRAGTGRNRGLGHLQAELFDHQPFSLDGTVEAVTDQWFKKFTQEVRS